MQREPSGCYCQNDRRRQSGALLPREPPRSLRVALLRRSFLLQRHLPLGPSFFRPLQPLRFDFALLRLPQIAYGPLLLRNNTFGRFPPLKFSSGLGRGLADVFRFARANELALERRDPRRFRGPGRRPLLSERDVGGGQEPAVRGLADLVPLHGQPEIARVLANPVGIGVER